jgi:hypothetical protein
MPGTRTLGHHLFSRLRTGLGDVSILSEFIGKNSALIRKSGAMIELRNSYPVFSFSRVYHVNAERNNPQIRIFSPNSIQERAISWMMSEVSLV